MDDTFRIRRLVEAGVSLVTVIFGGWDTHHTRDRLLPPLNRAFAALLADLKDRGLLETTMIAWTGEFGRTPIINGNSPPGCDHWGRVYSACWQAASSQRHGMFKMMP